MMRLATVTRLQEYVDKLERQAEIRAFLDAILICEDVGATEAAAKIRETLRREYDFPNCDC